MLVMHFRGDAVDDARRPEIEMDYVLGSVPDPRWLLRGRLTVLGLQACREARGRGAGL